MTDVMVKDEVYLSTIEEIIEDARRGKMFILVDDQNRENEGDFICAAEKITPEWLDLSVT